MAEQRRSSHLHRGRGILCRRRRARSGALDRGPQRVTVIGIAEQRRSTNWPSGARALVVAIRDLGTELIGRADVAFADAFDLGSMEGIELPAALALLAANGFGWRACERPLECPSKVGWPGILRLISRMMRGAACAGCATASDAG
jgi:hypothetical protein